MNPAVDLGQIAGYEILGKIGEGGMGWVYRARQLSLDRIVALKVLPPELTREAKRVERFLREARTAASLNHPCIVRIFDVGRSSTGVYYFSMEYVDGGTVRDLLKRQGKLPLERALAITEAVARALSHADRHGVLHRDVKPANIMLTSGGEAKLADLGIAWREAPEGEEQGRSSAVSGTPHYMSPEQIEGRELDIRSDLYSLGATCYHLLTGVPPFVASSTVEAVSQHLNAPVPDPREIEPAVPDRTAEMVMRLLAKRPEDRHPDADRLLEELHRMRGAGGGSAGFRLDRRWGWAAAGLLLAAGIPLVWNGYRRWEAGRDERKALVLYERMNAAWEREPPDLEAVRVLCKRILAEFPGSAYDAECRAWLERLEREDRQENKRRVQPWLNGQR
jgi:serine/threonine-protein kinase